MPPPPPNIRLSPMGSLLSLPPSSGLKRPRAASAPCDDEHQRHRKRSRGSDLTTDKIIEEDPLDLSPAGPSSHKGKEREPPPADSPSPAVRATASAVVDDLAQELKCGCCTELCYNPVIVNPCQHFFCGSCCVLWVRNGGTNCPACRSVSTSVTPSRVLQSMIDLLLRSDSSRARTENERAQADQVYRTGTTLRLPTPRPATPEPNLEPTNDNFARPCPTCLPGNAYGWRCPVPIPDPAADQDNAFDLDDGMPPGHSFCGNCDQLHNLQAPTSSKCDMCQVSFCGVGIQGRCCALGLLVQQPQGMAELQDVILSGSVYDCFRENSVEIDILVDYLRVNEISLRAVYKEIITHTLQGPDGFLSLIDMGIFEDLHAVSGGTDPDPEAPRRKICRLCAAQVLIYGLRDWWIRERKQGHLPAEVLARKDCPEGTHCDKQTDQAHAKELNHIIARRSVSPPGGHGALLPPPPPSAAAADPASAAQPTAEQSDVLPPDVDMLPPAPPLPALDPHPPHESSQAEVEAAVGSGAGSARPPPDVSAAGGPPPDASSVLLQDVAAVLLPDASSAPDASSVLRHLDASSVLPLDAAALLLPDAPIAGDVIMADGDDRGADEDAGDGAAVLFRAGAAVDPEVVLEMLQKASSSSSSSHVLALS